MNVVFQPTKTSYINVDVDINECGLGFQHTMKSDIFPFYSLTLFFLFITIYFEWAIDLSQIDHEKDGGDGDGEDS